MDRFTANSLIILNFLQVYIARPLPITNSELTIFVEFEAATEPGELFVTIKLKLRSIRIPLDFRVIQTFH